MRLISLVCILCLLLQGCVFLYRPEPMVQKHDDFLTCGDLLQTYETIGVKADKLKKSQDSISGLMLAPLYPLALINPMLIMYLAIFDSSTFNKKAGKSYVCRQDNLMKLMEEKNCPKSKYRSRSEYAFIDNVITGRRDYISEYCSNLK